MARQPAYTLSGGERRRLEICRALATAPSFILLDEPFAGIDPLAVLDIQKIIAHLQGPRDRRPHHRPQRARDLENHGPRLYSQGRRCLPLRHSASSSPPTRRCAASTWARLPARRAARPEALPRAEPSPWRIQQKLGLSARLSQRLILTPSLQQAIKLLPLTTLELAEVLEQEVMENPLLEEVPVQETLSAEEIAQRGGRGGGRAHDDPLKDIDVEKFFEDYFDDGGRAAHAARPRCPEMPPIENTLTESPDLYDHLPWQLRMTVSDELTLEIGEAIIQNLDEDGLLRASLEEIANMGPYADARRWRRRSPSCRPSTRRGWRRATSPSACASSSRHLGLEGSPADVMVRDHMKQLQSHQYPEIGAADGAHRRRGLAPPRDHQAPRPQARASSYSPDALRPTSCPTCSW